MNVTVDAKTVEELRADSRGRVNLGTEYANQTVTVAVVEVAEDE